MINISGEKTTMGIQKLVLKGNSMGIFFGIKMIWQDKICKLRPFQYLSGLL